MKKGKRAQVLVASVVLIVIALVLIAVSFVVLILSPQLINFNSVNSNSVNQEKQTSVTTTFYANQFVCYYPYIKVGTSCCLDSDNNGICDKDENNIYQTNKCYSPYIQIGSSCCLDENNNGICDQNENYYGYDYNYYSNYGNKYYEDNYAFPRCAGYINYRTNIVNGMVEVHRDCVRY